MGLVIALVGYVGTISAQEKIRYEVEPKMLSAKEKKQVKQEVGGLLKDPYSAVYGDIFSYIDPVTGERKICVFVNAKNAFGGYTGESAFQKSVNWANWASDEDLSGLRLGPLYTRGCLEAKNGYQLRYNTKKR